MLDDLRGDVRWWRGIATRDRRATRPVLDAAELDRGRLRLRLWREGRIVRGLTGLPEDTIETFDDLVALAGESAPALRRRLPDPPEWLATIAEAWQRFAAPPVTTTASVDGPPDHALLAWVEPLLTWARQQARDVVEKLFDDPRQLTDEHPVLAPDRDRVLSMIKQVLVLEFHVARLRGRASGTTSRERFASFITELSDPVRGLDLLADYPVLARELVFWARSWIDARVELAQRLTADAARLHAAFGAPAGGLAAVRDIRFGAGDAHRGGRSVALVTYEDGSKVVYKPRSLAVDRHVNNLIDWLNERGLRPPLRPVEVIDRGKYGWCRHVDPAPCRDRAQLERFYRRQGAHLALIHLLRGYDMHAWNVIAEGEHPAYIDVEALFHAEPHPPDGVPVERSVAGQALAEGVLTTQVLPRVITEAAPGERRPLGTGALAGGVNRGDLAIHPTVCLVDAGGDRMRITRGPEPAEPSRNRPELLGVAGEPPVLVDAVLAGFRSTYRLLRRHRTALSHRDGPLAAFEGADVRVVLRNTRFYVGLLDRSWHPDLLRDAFDRDLFLRRLGTGNRPHRGSDEILASELRQIDRRDIPAFHTTCGSRNLYDDGGLVVADFRARSGLAAVLSRLAAFSEPDLHQQTWLLRASLCTLLSPPRRTVPALTSHRPDPARALAAACRIGDRLIATALRDPADGSIEWLSLDRVEPRRWAVTAASLGLHSGVSGIILFLAELGAVSGVARYRELAEEAVEGLVGPGRIPSVHELRCLSVGAYQDLGGLMNLLLRLAELWAAPALLDRAQELAAAVAANLATCRRLDLLDGIAGAALTSARLHRVRPGPVTAEIMTAAAAQLTAALARHAPDGEQSPMGRPCVAAGLAYALAQVAEVTGREEDREPSIQALSVLSGARHDAAAWRTDAVGAGVAVAAVASLRVLAPAAELLQAILRRATAHASGGVADDSLGQGGLGRAELFSTAGAVLGEARWTEAADRWLSRAADRVTSGRIVTAVPGGVWTPGLLLGASGIGHGLLRAAAPGIVPSVLALP